MQATVQSPGTPLIEPFSVAYDLEQGLMHGAKNHLVRRASDMRGYYAEAGHNYGDSAQQGFPKRVFVRAGRSVIE